jgi:hypothetical protein
MALLPDQAPDARHDVAFAADHVRAELLPLITELGLAAILTVGAADFTDTVADCAALPPAPVQVSVYVAVAVSAPVDREPLSAVAPDQAPEALQAVAWVAAQFKVALPPLLIALGPTLRVTVGVGDFLEILADWTAVPPGPEQLSV